MRTLTLSERYRLRLSRKRLLWRGFRKRHEVYAISVNKPAIRAAPILLFATMRNEAMRLPYFLDHYRRLGVGHFLIVSNDSTDGTDDFLATQQDVSLWGTNASYKEARFGMDWLTWLLRRYGSGKWVVTADADELLIYPDHEARPLPELTRWMEAKGQQALGAMLLDLYPKGSPDEFIYDSAQPPMDVLNWFDATGYSSTRRGRHHALCTIGGPRARAFFANAPSQAPVLSKTPLVRWRRSYVYFSSTHVLLPRRLNEWHIDVAHNAPTGLLLHTKFLPGIGVRAREDKSRAQQYTRVPEHDAYYDALAHAPDLWTDQSTELKGWRQLSDLGLMRGGGWFGVR